MAKKQKPTPEPSSPEDLPEILEDELDDDAPAPQAAPVAGLEPAPDSGAGDSASGDDEANSKPADASPAPPAPAPPAPVKRPSPQEGMAQWRNDLNEQFEIVPGSWLWRQLGGARRPTVTRGELIRFGQTPERLIALNVLKKKEP